MQEEGQEINNLKQLLEKSSQSLSNFVDVNKVIGTPVTTPQGTQIIPFTKVTIGYLCGGGEYDGKRSTDLFSGGGGSIVKLQPCGFLVDDGRECKLLRVTDDPLDSLVEKGEELLSKLIKKEKQ